MNEYDVKQKLEELAERQAQLSAVMAEKQNAIDAVMTAEMRQKLAEIDNEFASATDALSQQIESLEQQIKYDVAEFGASVKGSLLQAVYSKGRVSWDTKGLDKYANEYPAVLAYREIGKPSVSLRQVK